MVTIFELLKEEEQKIKEISKLRQEVAKEEIKDEDNEASIWLNTDFKAKGLSNDKMRTAYVTQQKHLLYPSFVSSKKGQIYTLQDEIKCIRQKIEVMKEFGVSEIDFEKTKSEDKKQTDGSQSSD